MANSDRTAPATAGADCSLVCSKCPDGAVSLFRIFTVDVLPFSKDGEKLMSCQSGPPFVISPYALKCMETLSGETTLPLSFLPPFSFKVNS